MPLRGSRKAYMSIFNFPSIYTVKQVKALTDELNRLNSAFNAKCSENIDLKLQNDTLMQENAAMVAQITELKSLLDAKEVAIGKRDERINRLHTTLTKLDTEYRQFRYEVLQHIIEDESYD